MRLSTRVVSVLTVAGAGLVVWVTTAAGSGGHSGVSRQAFQATESNSDTSSKGFRRLTGLSLQVGNRDKSVVGSTFSGTFTGAPVEIRVAAGGEAMSPGAARFGVGSPLPRSFSFTFAKNLPLCSTLEVQWRSPTGEKVVFRKGSLSAFYRPLGEKTVCR